MEDEVIEPGQADQVQSGPDALDRIMMEAAGQEREQDAADEAAMNPDAPPGVDQAAVWAQIPFMLGGMLGMAMPELKPVYTQEACYAWGAGMAAVSDKYGWDAGETAAKWAPECALLMASIPLIVPTVQAVKTRQAAIAAQKRKELQKRRENAVEVPSGASGGGYDGDAESMDYQEHNNMNPMMQPPGNFSEPH